MLPYDVEIHFIPHSVVQGVVTGSKIILEALSKLQIFYIAFVGLFARPDLRQDHERRKTRLEEISAIGHSGNFFRDNRLKDILQIFRLQYLPCSISPGRGASTVSKGVRHSIE
jgi:hypothetical protein